MPWKGAGRKPFVKLGCWVVGLLGRFAAPKPSYRATRLPSNLATRGRLPETRLELLQLVVPVAELIVRELRERGRHGVVLFMQVARVGLQVEQAGGNLPRALAVADVGTGPVTVGRVVVLRAFAQAHPAPVVQHHIAHGTGFVVSCDRP